MKFLICKLVFQEYLMHEMRVRKFCVCVSKYVYTYVHIIDYIVLCMI